METAGNNEARNRGRGPRKGGPEENLPFGCSQPVSCCRDLLLSMRLRPLARLVLGDGDPVDGHAARRSFENAAGVVDNFNREPCHRLARDHKDRHRGVVAPPVDGLTKRGGHAVVIWATRECGDRDRDAVRTRRDRCFARVPLSEARAGRTCAPIARRYAGQDRLRPSRQLRPSGLSRQLRPSGLSRQLRPSHQLSPRKCPPGKSILHDLQHALPGCACYVRCCWGTLDC